MKKKSSRKTKEKRSDTFPSKNKILPTPKTPVAKESNDEENYRWQFFIRSKAFLEINNKVREINELDENIKDKWGKWDKYFNEILLPKYPWLINESPVGKFIDKYDQTGKSDCLYFMANGYIGAAPEGKDYSRLPKGKMARDPAIKIRLLRMDRKSAFWHDGLYQEKNLEKSELKFKKDMWEKHGDKYTGEEPLSIFGVNGWRNTITIQVGLGDSKQKIKDDFALLLDILDKEAEVYGYDFKRRKHRPLKGSDSIFKKYDLLLKVWEEFAEEKKKISQVAEDMFPEAFKLGGIKAPVGNKKRFWEGNEDDPMPTDPESAIKKVRRYYNEAERMINGGGWREI